LLLIRHRAEVT